jgi:hypothetical protein
MFEEKEISHAKLNFAKAASAIGITAGIILASYFTLIYSLDKMSEQQNLCLHSETHCQPK